MQAVLLAIDPGKNIGWAAFRDGVLWCCGLVKCMDKDSASAIPRRVPTATNLVVEVPQVYAGPRAKGDPNDLIQVAVCAGWVIGQYTGADLRAVKPSEWKGQEPKDITEKRVLESLSSFENSVLEAERAKVKKSVAHNMVDAVGIGLWALRRKIGAK